MPATNGNRTSRNKATTAMTAASIAIQNRIGLVKLMIRPSDDPIPVIGRINIPQCSSLALMLPLDVEPIVCDARKMVQWPPRRQPQPTEEVTLIARAMRWLEPQALERRRPDRCAMLRCERQP